MSNKKRIIEQLIFQNLIYNKEDIIEKPYYNGRYSFVEYEIKLINNQSLFIYKIGLKEYIFSALINKSNKSIFFTNPMKEKDVVKRIKATFGNHIFFLEGNESLKFGNIINKIQEYLHESDKIYYKNFNYNILDLKNWFSKQGKGKYSYRITLNLCVWQFSNKKKVKYLNLSNKKYYYYKEIIYKIYFNKNYSYQIDLCLKNRKEEKRLLTMGNSFDSGNFEKDLNYIINEVNTNLPDKDKYPSFSFNREISSNFWESDLNNNIKEIMKLLNPYRDVNLKKDYQENSQLVESYYNNLLKADKLINETIRLYNSNIHQTNLVLKEALENNIKRTKEYYKIHRKAYKILFKAFIEFSEDYLHLA
jgi:hypothetical protein